MKITLRGRGRTILVATSAAAALAGASLIGVAVAAQQSAPQPPAASARAPVDTETVPAPSTTSPNVASTASPTPSAPRSVPVALTIPAIGVHASFVTLGLDPHGAIQVPTDVHHVGWYRLGPAPGQAGPAIVLGHVDSARSGAGVFYRLGALTPGDAVSVTLADGGRVTYAVYAVREYAKDAFPTATVYGHTDDSQLRLITCGGAFDSGTGHYESNVVVFARQSAPTP
jgi:sortase (surface protein transpeptidase)